LEIKGGVYLKPNSEIRKAIRTSGFCLWQVAHKLEVHENTFFRKLRKPLRLEEKKRFTASWKS
jgi:hypothetical protein